MGQQLLPQLVCLIAAEQFKHISQNFQLPIILDRAYWQVIDEIVGGLRAATKGRQQQEDRLPTCHKWAMGRVLEVKPEGILEERRLVLDILIADFEPGPLYLELKTPKPNLDTCAESKRKILTFEAFMRTEGDFILVEGFSIHRPNEKARGYLVFPYGTRESYRHTFTQRILDMQEEVLIGAELWDLIGGASTFEQLLDIIDEVREEVPLL